jgi:hypothetical protein
MFGVGGGVGRVVGRNNKVTSQQECLITIQVASQEGSICLSLPMIAFQATSNLQLSTLNLQLAEVKLFTVPLAKHNKKVEKLLENDYFHFSPSIYNNKISLKKIEYYFVLPFPNIYF